jgi:hypothetical protein
VVDYDVKSSSTSVTTSPVSILSVTITAPANGFVHLLATGAAHFSSDGAFVWYGLGTTSGGYNLAKTLAGDGLAGTKTTYWYDSMTVQAVASVASGYTFTCYATIYKQGTPNVELTDAYLSAIFYAT